MSELALKGKGKGKITGKSPEVLRKLFEATAALEGCWMGDGPPPLADQTRLALQAVRAVQKTGEYYIAVAIQELEDKRAAEGSLSEEDEVLLRKLVNRTDEFDLRR
jgi:hypothetical protein